MIIQTKTPQPPKAASGGFFSPSGPTAGWECGGGGMWSLFDFNPIKWYSEHI
jgi:hypothetical protein